jgi:hypothetical protein
LLADRKKKSIFALVLYAVLLILLVIGVVCVIPAGNQERYESALVCIENGDYRQAREQLRALGNYKDAAERYDEIAFTELQVGEHVVMGMQYNKPDSLRQDKALEWTVIAVEEGKALLLSDAILTSIDDRGSSAQWEKNTSLLRNQLSSLGYVFDENEKSQILPHSYEITVDGESVTVTDELFLLSRAELEQYCTQDQIYSKKDTSYNDHQVLKYQMDDSDYEYVYSYYVRDTDEDGKWIMVDCVNRDFVAKNTSYVGIRPAMYVSMDTETDDVNP